MLVEALTSVAMQTRPFDQIIVSMDHAHLGAPANIARAFAAVDCDYTVQLGDDDWLDLRYLERCIAAAEETGCDVIYPGYTVVGGEDPFAWMQHRPYDAETRLDGIPGGGSFVRVQAIKDAGGMPLPGDADFPAADLRWPGSTHEDHALWQRLHANGATFYHLDEPLYFWRHWTDPETGQIGNTSGRGDRW